jgi:WD40 repeat protein
LIERTNTNEQSLFLAILFNIVKIMNLITKAPKWKAYRYWGLFFTAAIIPMVMPAQPRISRLPATLKEVSGMTRTQNNLWLLNDSGNSSDIFLYDVSKKTVLKTIRLPMKNHDWEDLAHDPSGKLYIGDFGNNLNARKNLQINIFDPSTGDLDSIKFAYPDQKAFPPGATKDWNFNCEAMVWFQDSLHLFSKNVFDGNGVCKHYVLPAKAGAQVPVLRDSIVIKNRVVTGAALSNDGRSLLFTSYIIKRKYGIWPYTRGSLISFTGFAGSSFFKGTMKRKKLRKFLVLRQYESLTEWSPGVWLVANEGRGPYRQRIKRIRYRP